nr:hypothetical protein [Tanacetum cinerariifolium]
LHLNIPAPCAESWDAMTPTSLGRHCAACQKTVVDFTQKTDAEILAYFAKATGETCGRLGNDQLNRPLLPAIGARPAAHWRGWLALVLAAWGLRASPAATTGAPAANSPTATHPRKKTSPKHRLPLAAPRLLHGTEIHPATSQYLPPPPPPEILPPTIDSTTVGDIKTLMADSTAVSAAPHSSGELVNDILGEPEKY